MIKIVTHFSKKEFACPCCGLCNMDSDFVFQLEVARRIAGVPFKINSGHRCEKQNAKVGGKKDSAHMTGHAADIHVQDSAHRMKILKGLTGAGFTRIGVYKGFFHVDNDSNKPQGVSWMT